VQNYLQSYLVPEPRYKSHLALFESRKSYTRGPEASKAEQSKHGMGSTLTDPQRLSDSFGGTYKHLAHSSNRRPLAEPGSGDGLSS
ncbi:hypothetical protein QBC32DRAFT_172476, partial [Pseudoneurospora amorphoporcata]